MDRFNALLAATRSMSKAASVSFAATESDKWLGTVEVGAVVLVHAVGPPADIVEELIRQLKALSGRMRAVIADGDKTKPE